MVLANFGSSSLFIGLGPWEIVLILIIILIIFGPKKLPELAKAIGESIRTYRKSSSGLFEEEAKPQIKSEAAVLVETAKKLGIKTEGKTLEQISEEIARATTKPPS